MIAKVKVVSSRALTPTAHAIQIEKPRGFDFLPVQFCGLEIETDEGGIEYTMSLATSPTRPHLEFGARVASGSAWKRAFAALQPGDVVEVDGAYGHFILDATRPAVLVAGGIGVTPLKGMLEYATDKRLSIDVSLVYSNKTPDEIAYEAELDTLAAANPHARILHTITRAPPTWTGRKGRVGAALLREAATGMQDPIYYLCGLPQMVEDVYKILAAEGVPRERVRYELFTGYE